MATTTDQSLKQSQRFMNVSYRLLTFDADLPAPAQDLAQLHTSLLPASPISLLGPQFIERFYYSILPQEGLIFGTVAYVDNRPAGFVAATDNPAGFMKSAVRRRWPKLVWVLGTSLLWNPSCTGAVLEACRLMWTRRRKESSEPVGEILSMGVLPAYREAGFVRETGLRISHELLNSAVTRLLMGGAAVIRALVNAENTATKLFYNGLGWTLNRNAIPGYDSTTVEFVWRANNSSRNNSNGSASIASDSASPVKT